MKKQSSLSDLVTATALRIKLDMFSQQQLSNGLLPFEGRWLTIEEVEQQIAERHKRSKVVLRELLLAFVLLGGLGVLFILLTFLLAY